MDAIGYCDPDDYVDHFEAHLNALKPYGYYRLGKSVVPRPYNATLSDDKFAFANYIEGIIPNSVAKTFLYIHRGGKVGIGPGLYRDAIEAMGDLPNGKFVCKPTLGQCGRDIIIACVENGNVSFSSEEAEDSFHAGIAKEPYIVQEFIVQHESMKALNPTSVNTVRINTTRFNQNSHYFVSMVRIGVTDALVDNAAAGGTCVGVDFETGRLMKYGCYHSKPRETHHPITGIKYENYQIPYWTESVNLVLYLHQFFRGFPSLGWDVAITESGPKLIENNYDWAFGILQQIHGGLKKKWERAKLLP